MESQVLSNQGSGRTRVAARMVFKIVLFLVSLDFVLAGVFLLWQSLSPLFEKGGSDRSGLIVYPILLASEFPAVVSLIATGVVMFLLLYFINKFSKHKRFMVGLSIGLLTIAFLIFLTISTFNTFFSSFGFSSNMWEILLFKSVI